MSKEFDRAQIPAVLITAMAPMAKMLSANRIVLGLAIPYPCGDPNLPETEDFRLRKALVHDALKALETEVQGPTIFEPEVLKTISSITY